MLAHFQHRSSPNKGVLPILWIHCSLQRYDDHEYESTLFRQRWPLVPETFEEATTESLLPQHASPLPIKTIFLPIWKHRNSIIFTATNIPNEVLLRLSNSWSQHFMAFTPLVSLKEPESIQWQSGPIDFYTINTDGTVNPQSTFGSIGGLLREFWGIYEGLCLAWTYGFEKVVIQTDCSEAYNLVSSSHSCSSDLMLVRAISALVDRSWFIDFLRILHEANFAANHLAKLNTSEDGVCRIFTDPPQSLLHILNWDLNGPVFLHR
ncbi:hypothetical protein V6N11_039339 [Hibiscus sabdariffa]|uniref:RNase H type-1 domain-containing protein n=1 Tax=Hibiscus sabdariffa TaxID=183260 RepID=A0ABR2SMP8_9ROSI